MGGAKSSREARAEPFEALKRGVSTEQSILVVCLCVYAERGRERERRHTQTHHTDIRTHTYTTKTTEPYIPPANRNASLAEAAAESAERGVESEAVARYPRSNKSITAVADDCAPLLESDVSTHVAHKCTFTNNANPHDTQTHTAHPHTHSLSRTFRQPQRSVPSMQRQRGSALPVITSRNMQETNRRRRCNLSWRQRKFCVHRR